MSLPRSKKSPGSPLPLLLNSTVFFLRLSSKDFAFLPRCCLDFCVLARRSLGTYSWYSCRVQLACRNSSLASLLTELRSRSSSCTWGSTEHCQNAISQR